MNKPYIMRKNTKGESMCATTDHCKAHVVRLQEQVAKRTAENEGLADSLATIEDYVLDELTTMTRTPSHNLCCIWCRNKGEEHQVGCRFPQLEQLFVDAASKSKAIARAAAARKVIEVAVDLDAVLYPDHNGIRGWIGDMLLPKIRLSIPASRLSIALTALRETEGK